MNVSRKNLTVGHYPTIPSRLPVENNKQQNMKYCNKCHKRSSTLRFVKYCDKNEATKINIE